MPVREQISTDFLRFLKAKTVSRLSMIAGTVMLFGGLLLIGIDYNLGASDPLRNIALLSVQSFEQIIGFPLPVNGFALNSISAVGVATSISGFDLLAVSLGLSVHSRSALWVGTIIFTLATFFDFTLFLLMGLLGAPVSLPGTIVNLLMAYTLVKDRKLFTEESRQSSSRKYIRERATQRSSTLII